MQPIKSTFTSFANEVSENPWEAPKKEGIESLFSLIEQSISELSKPMESDEEFSDKSYSSSGETQKKIQKITLTLMQGFGLEEEVESEKVWKNIESVVAEASNLGCQKKNWKEFVTFRVTQERNALENKLLFRKEVKNFTNSENFLLRLGLKKGEEGAIEFSKADSHHGGKVPFQFKSDSLEKEVKVFVKPRKADLDIAILSLFSDLNKVGNKSIDTALPSYNVENVEGFSVWDFIEGCEPGEGFKFISPMLEKIEAAEPVKKDLRLKLSRLEQVARAIGLSDLHGENIIFTNIRKKEDGEGLYEIIDHHKEVNIVPIDLESIQEGQATGLISNDEQVDLKDFTTKEKELVKSFKEACVGTPFRLVPVATATFIDYIGSPERIGDLQGLVIESLQNKKLNFDGDLVKKYIVLCFGNKEVPFFTCLKNEIFPGALG